MNRPSIRTYLAGNPLSLTACWMIFAYAVYRCWSGEINPLLPILTFMLASYASKSAVQIGKFNRWQREWNAMNSGRQKPGWSRIPGLRAVPGVIIWAAAGYYLAIHSDDPDQRISILVFVLCTIALAIIILFRILKGALGLFRRMPASKRAVPVTVCLGRAAGSPTVAHAFASLPDYCAELLAPPGAERAAVPHAQRRS